LPIAAYEAALGVARVRRIAVEEAQAAIERFLEASMLRIVPITGEIGRLAVVAFARFGRGLHPAGLNMGDCFAYACARSLEVPLLCKGGDFRQTDMVLA
jgi:ribonuclease VapC